MHCSAIAPCARHSHIASQQTCYRLHTTPLAASCFVCMMCQLGMLCAAMVSRCTMMLKPAHAYMHPADGIDRHQHDHAPAYGSCAQSTHPAAGIISVSVDGMGELWETLLGMSRPQKLVVLTCPQKLVVLTCPNKLSQTSCLPLPVLHCTVL